MVWLPHYTAMLACRAVTYSSHKQVILVFRSLEMGNIPNAIKRRKQEFGTCKFKAPEPRAVKIFGKQFPDWVCWPHPSCTPSPSAAIVCSWACLDKFPP